MGYQTEKTKAATIPLPSYNVEGCGQLTLCECNKENIYWRKTNLSVVIDQESAFPQVTSQVKKLILGGTQAFHTYQTGTT